MHFAARLSPASWIQNSLAERDGAAFHNRKLLLLLLLLLLLPAGLDPYMMVEFGDIKRCTRVS